MIIQRHAIYQAGRHCGVVAPAGGAAIPMAKARGLRRSKENWSAGKRRAMIARTPFVDSGLSDSAPSVEMSQGHPEAPHGVAHMAIVSSV